MDVDPTGGVVVMTRFECTTVRRLLTVIAMHWRVKRDVRRHARGFVAVRMLVQFRQRVVISLSIWQDLDSVYSMGDIPRHVTAARLPASLKIRTAAGVFCYAGDWRRVMFGGTGGHGSPLRPIGDRPSSTDEAEQDDAKG